MPWTLSRAERVRYLRDLGGQFRAEDLDHPDELRVDLDPVPWVDWAQIVRVALVAREVLADYGLTGWP
ncbi:MAG TPA: hypothetical protein VFE26_12840, partial [Trebonia sp.]|nr:hypothetical protein [Trebonia sp.]